MEILQFQYRYLFMFEFLQIFSLVNGQMLSDNEAFSIESISYDLQLNILQVFMRGGSGHLRKDRSLGRTVLRLI